MTANLIYLTYNSEDDIPALPHLISTAGMDLPVIAIDNCSGDGSAQAMRDLGLNVHVPQRNLGFTAGVNTGLLNCSADWAVIANPDVRPMQRGWLVDLLDVPGNCGIVGARLLQGAMVMGGGSIMDAPAPVIRKAPHSIPGGSVLCDELLGWSRMTQYTGGPQDHTHPKEVSWVAFAACAIRMEMLREIGFLDERFWHFYSDNELCVRAWKHGWTVRYQPVTFAHEGSATLKFAPDHVVERTRRDVVTWCEAEPRILYEAKF